MASSAEGVGLGFETLLGIIAVTTFLVGFSTVRLQASLQEWRERGERVINRLLEQNAGEDLLPLPTTLRSLSGTTKSLKIDPITWLTLGASTISLYAFAFLTSELQDRASSFERTLLSYLNALTVIIFFVGVVDAVLVKFKSRREGTNTPSRVFARLEQNLRDWSRAPRETNYLTSGAITNRCQEFEALIPDWCWITLIRYDLAQYWDTHHERSEEVSQWRKVPFSANGIDIILLPLWLIRLVTFQFRTPALELKTGRNSAFLLPAVQRLRNLSHATKATDSHSLIAWVWTSFLTIGNREGALNDLPTIDDLEKIERFRRRTDDTFAELALRCAQRNWPNPDSETSNRLRVLGDGLPKYQKKGWRSRVWERATAPLRLDSGG
jgi:hypothetical protein